MSFLLMLIVCFFVGLPFYLVYLLIKSKKRQYFVIQSTSVPTEVNVKNQQDEKTEKDPYIDALILKPKQQNKVNTSPYIEGLIGISIVDIKRQNDKFNYLTINIFIKNLSDKYLSVRLANAYYITSSGEQIKGSVRKLEIAGIDNSVIMPFLKIQAPIYFYDQIRELYENDILLVQILVGDKVFALSTNIRNSK